MVIKEKNSGKIKEVTEVHRMSAWGTRGVDNTAPSFHYNYCVIELALVDEKTPYKPWSGRHGSLCSLIARQFTIR